MWPNYPPDSINTFEVSIRMKQNPPVYFFECPVRGACQVAAHVSGVHGFGAPKMFVFTCLSDSVPGSLTLWYRDIMASTGVHDEPKRNHDLLLAAISQFCASSAAHSDQQRAELDATTPSFGGEVLNRHGRIMSRAADAPANRPAEHMPTTDIPRPTRLQ